MAHTRTLQGRLALVVVAFQHLELEQTYDQQPKNDQGSDPDTPDSHALAIRLERIDKIGAGHHIVPSAAR